MSQSQEVLGDDALEVLNSELAFLKQNLEERYEIVHRLLEQEADESSFQDLLSEVNDLKDQIAEKEDLWRRHAVEESKEDDEGYALWDQEETTLSQLVMEYGGADFLYVIPPEMAQVKIHMHSAIPIPRESWNDLLEIILSQNGVGVKKLNAFSKQLYSLKQNLVAASEVVDHPQDLEKIPDLSRVIYIFSPQPERAKSVTHFFERFRDPKMSFVYQVGHKVAIVAYKEEVKKLLKLYDTIWEKESQKVTKIFPIKKLSIEEMEKILSAFFNNPSRRNRISWARGEDDDITILPLPHEGSMVIIGVKEMVAKAEKIITETEEQIEDPTEMTVYWYNCRHSDPIDISDVLQRVYTSLITSSVTDDKKDKYNHYPHPYAPPPPPPPDAEIAEHLPPAPSYGPPPYTPVVHPPVALAATVESQKEVSKTTNFIPYTKTGAIMMVVRKDTLEKIKELLRKLDVPKKMVHIEVLLFEKKINNQNNFGLNLLKLGSAASNTHATGLDYESFVGSPKKGIVDFFLRRTKSKHFPAIDIAYNFLMAQEDVRINSAPSISTLNQTPAQIALVEEISVSDGAAPVDSNAGLVFKESFSRAQYGTTIVITPTIHEPDLDSEDQDHYVTLETNVTFDTTKNDENNRPTVNRRHVENFVRVLDGETVILGGLRKKTADETTEKLPFLGEIPRLGKLFGTSRMLDQQTEMFIFITPKVIVDPKTEAIALRNQELSKRPGDLPEFLERIEEAKKAKKRKIFANSLKLIFGTVDDNW